MRPKDFFLKHIAQTSPFPQAIEIAKAEGMYIYDVNGKAYLDLNAGISVSALGHKYPAVVEAISNQANLYLHTMVYGEHIQSPQISYAQLLFQHIDGFFDNIYYVNSGAEAVECAMKLARKYTGRAEILSAYNSYHGSTLGAESLRSDISYTQNFVPCVPGVNHIRYGITEDLNKISEKTAAVIIEPLQAEAGIIIPSKAYLKALREKCSETQTLLIFDEIQTGFGRTGTLFCHQFFNLVPDVLLIAKGMGGGMPIGGVVTNREIMSCLGSNPILGHITTFGGNAVCLAAACATLNSIIEKKLVDSVNQKGLLFKEKLVHPAIKEVRYLGLMIGVELTPDVSVIDVVNKIVENGAFVDFLLFNENTFRIAPPLIIEEKEILKGCEIILKSIDDAVFSIT